MNFDIAPWIPCCKCNAPIVVDSSNYKKYFYNDPIMCTGCNSHIDWWEIVRRAIKDNLFENQVFATLGAESKIIAIYLEPEKKVKINLSEHGIPPDARILYINYTPQGGDLFPIEMHGNIPHRRGHRNEIVVYPVPFSNSNGGSRTKVSVMVTWINHSPDEVSLINITDSFEYYSNGHYQDCIVPANVSVESALSKLLTSYISKIASKNRTENFLTNDATYSSQLNVVLPMIVKFHKAPTLTDTIRGQLNKLRGFRNDIAHNGTTKKELNKDDTADVLCAALFGLNYIYLIDEIIKNA